MDHQGYGGEQPAEKAEKHGIHLEVVKHSEAKKGFVHLPRRWVVERDFCVGESVPEVGQRP